MQEATLHIFMQHDKYAGSDLDMCEALSDMQKQLYIMQYVWSFMWYVGSIMWYVGSIMWYVGSICKKHCVMHRKLPYTATHDVSEKQPYIV